MSGDFEDGTANQAYTDEEMAGWWDVTKIGTWQGSKGGKPFDVVVTAETIAQMAADYDRELLYSPVTTDHKQEYGALGWVEQLRVDGDKLQAKVSWSGFGDWSVKNRDYVNRSAEIADPLKLTGRAYLSGLTFLGAGKPAARGISPQPALMADGQDVITVSGEAVQLSESTTFSKQEEKVEISEATLKEKVIGWFKELASGEVITTTDNKEKDVKELKEATEQIVTLSEKNTVLTGEVATLTEANAKLTGELSEAKEANVKLTTEVADAKTASESAEREAEMSKLSAALDTLVEGEKMLPAEKEFQVKLAEGVATDKLAGHIEAVGEMLKARSLNLFSEQTKPEQTIAAPSRTAGMRALAALDSDPVGQKLTLDACNLQDADETGKLTFTDALARLDAAK